MSHPRAKAPAVATILGVVIAAVLPPLLHGQGQSDSAHARPGVQRARGSAKNLVVPKALFNQVVGLTKDSSGVSGNLRWVRKGGKIEFMEVDTTASSADSLKRDSLAPAPAGKKR